MLRDGAVPLGDQSGASARRALTFPAPRSALLAALRYVACPSRGVEGTRRFSGPGPWGPAFGGMPESCRASRMDERPRRRNDVVCAVRTDSPPDAAFRPRQVLDPGPLSQPTWLFCRDPRAHMGRDSEGDLSALCLGADTRAEGDSPGSTAGGPALMSPWVRLFDARIVPSFAFSFSRTHALALAPVSLSARVQPRPTLARDTQHRLLPAAPSFGQACATAVRLRASSADTCGRSPLSADH